MPKIPFFGSNDDDDEPFKRVESADIESHSDVEVIDLNDLDEGTTTIGATQIHTISIGSDDSTSTRDGPSVTREPTPQVEPEPTPDTEPVPRGTLAFPNDRDFMQKLEARAVNGHGRFVETVYALTGPTHTTPVDLFRLDNPEHYGSATRTSVSFYPRRMAREIAALFPDGKAPGLIVRFHTHPPDSSPSPSAKDKQSAKSVSRAFEQAFGTDEFEFFHGIHALDEHNLAPTAEERQNPSVRGQEIRWVGERYRHRLAVYDERFLEKKDVTIVGGT